MTSLPKLSESGKNYTILFFLFKNSFMSYGALLSYNGSIYNAIRSLLRHVSHLDTKSYKTAFDPACQVPKDPCRTFASKQKSKFVINNLFRQSHRTNPPLKA